MSICQQSQEDCIGGEPYSTNMDVEELVRFGVKKKACPFFLAREALDGLRDRLCSLQLFR